MSPELGEHLDALSGMGWKVSRLSNPTSLPKTIVDRYAWVPRHVLDFVSEIEVAESADQKAWLLSASDYTGTSGAAFAWNECELLELNAAVNDDDWKRQITGFWDNHFPILMSLKSGYAFCAIAREGNAIVVGEEPEFEEISRLAASLCELLQMIAGGDSRLERWV